MIKHAVIYEEAKSERGDLFVISAPSGAGKSTICHRLVEETAGVAFSVSHTTREPRRGEVDGVDYHFVSRDAFMSMAEHGEFIEWAEVHGNCYGTSREAVINMLVRGMDVLLDIDVQGAMQVKKIFNDPVLVFIVPPSLEVLEQRLRGRGTDSDETISLRLENASAELARISEYRYLIVNDDLIRATGDLQSVILSRRCRRERVLARCGLEYLLHSDTA